jgi:transcriptional regulator with XRE-family HTH domain
MSTENCGVTDVGLPLGVVLPTADHSDSPALHRLAAVRRQQGISRRVIARRLNIDMDEVRRQESETEDLKLSTLYAWQKALDVPVSELLVESGESLAPPVLKRSQLVRLMKTVLEVAEQTHQVSIRRMAETMVAQLTEIMPELAEVAPWHAVGERRRRDELGVAALRHFSDDVFFDDDL